MPLDYDPENEAPDEDTEESDSEDAHDEERIVTDHYEAVGYVRFHHSSLPVLTM